VGAVVTDGTARVAILGAGHSIAYTLGCGVLLVQLARRAGGTVWPAGLVPMASVACAVGLLAWRAGEALAGSDRGRVELVGVVAALAAAGIALVLGAHRVLGLGDGLTRRLAGEAQQQPALPSGDEVLP
jgi:peptidoglycan biosynthesis protein MviN/MurJ (putative lipid II flippase)